jgi:hypothetical protein
MSTPIRSRLFRTGHTGKGPPGPCRPSASERPSGTRGRPGSNRYAISYCASVLLSPNGRGRTESYRGDRLGGVRAAKRRPAVGGPARLASEHCPDGSPPRRLGTVATDVEARTIKEVEVGARGRKRFAGTSHCRLPQGRPEPADAGSRRIPAGAGTRTTRCLGGRVGRREPLGPGFQVNSSSRTSDLTGTAVEVHDDPLEIGQSISTLTPCRSQNTGLPLDATGGTGRKLESLPHRGYRDGPGMAARWQPVSGFTSPAGNWRRPGPRADSSAVDEAVSPSRGDPGKG